MYKFCCKPVTHYYPLYTVHLYIQYTSPMSMSQAFLFAHIQATSATSIPPADLDPSFTICISTARLLDSFISISFNVIQGI